MWLWLWNEIVLTLLGARWLGHGRAVESMLTLIAGTYGIILIFDRSVLVYSAATIDLVWLNANVGYMLAGALLTKAVLTGYGLLANIHAWWASRTFRFLGALLGSMIWAWYVSKYSLIGTPINLGSIFAIWAFIYSVRIMALAIANLPRPGACGTL